jgi:serine/tyrosine/threonine adenylyltransferase
MTKTQAQIETGWNFDNSYARLPEIYFQRLDLNPVRAPKLTIFNHSLATSLGLNIEALQSEEGVGVLSGNRVPEGALPLAQAYAGHQFGYFTMLGDGRALLIGEQITKKGERFDIQLKGSGRTPFSRGGDGRAALGPMIREYIISEAMHALGIKTTRSLSVVSTGESVYRETELPGAVLTRVASSHIRVGTFQYVAKWGTVLDLKELADYTIKRHFKSIEESEHRYLSLLREVIKGQASLIAKWNLVGFIHGVMNTDNMAISGETIDYGPCAFMDAYDPATVFSSIDVHGRYAYGNQPDIAGWNLARFAETLVPLLHDKKEQAVKLAQDEIAGFSLLYHGYWLAGMRTKLGILNEESEDEALFESLFRMMYKYRSDYTNTFRALTLGEVEESLVGTPEFKEWYAMWEARLGRQEASKEMAKQFMIKSNPAIIPRNHRVEEAIQAMVQRGDRGVMDMLLEVLSNPFSYSKEQEEYTKVPMPSTCAYRTFCGT